MPRKFFVSYTVVPSAPKDRGYRQHAVFFTDDLEAILMGIIPTRRRTGRGRIQAQLREYRDRGRVSYGRAGNSGVIKDITIREMPQDDEKVIAKYFYA